MSVIAIFYACVYPCVRMCVSAVGVYVCVVVSDSVRGVELNEAGVGLNNNVLFAKK